MPLIIYAVCTVAAEFGCIVRNIELLLAFFQLAY